MLKSGNGQAGAGECSAAGSVSVAAELRPVGCPTLGRDGYPGRSEKEGGKPHGGSSDTGPTKVQPRTAQGEGSRRSDSHQHMLRRAPAPLGRKGLCQP